MNDVELAFAAPEEWMAVARWHERGESPQSIARRIDDTLRRLEACSPRARGWLLQDTDGDFSVAYSVEAVEADLIARACGFAAGFICALRGSAASPRALEFDVLAGMHDSHAGVNSAVLAYDPQLPLSEVPTLDENIMILRVLADVWDPDYSFISSSWVEAPIWKRRPERVPVVGWLTYLPRRRGALPQLPAPARVVDTALGHIIIATPDRLSPTRPETLEAVEAVRSALQTAGLLYPEPIRDGEFASQ